MSVKVVGYSVFCPGGDEEMFFADEVALQTIEQTVCSVCGYNLTIEGITEYVK